MLIDLGSTGNYLSAQCQTALDLKVKPEEDFERLTLVDGSEVCAQGYAQFVLHCGDYKTKIRAWVFPNLHEELILGIPWLVQENPTFDWATGHVTIEKKGSEYTLPCYRQCLNNPEDRDKKTSTAEEINFISAKAMKKQIQRRTSDDRVFLGLIPQVDEGTEDNQLVALLTWKSYVGQTYPQQFGRSWKHIQMYSHQNCQRAYPPVRMGP